MQSPARLFTISPLTVLSLLSKQSTPLCINVLDTLILSDSNSLPSTPVLHPSNQLAKSWLYTDL